MSDVVSYNTLIKAQLQAGNMKKAKALVEEMKAEQLQPNCITFNEIVNATELWQRMGTVADELQAAGKMPVPGTRLGTGEAQDAVSSAVLMDLQRLQEDFIALQQQAYEIGEDSPDNEALARHPQIEAYFERLRSFEPELRESLAALDKEYARVLVKPRQKQKDLWRRIASRFFLRKTKEALGPLGDLNKELFCGSSLSTLRAKAKKRLARDPRNYKTKAMEEMTIFRERQLEMQDKNREMLARMEGPDWPAADWPLSNADARHDIIHTGVASLQRRVPNGIPMLHETNDEAALEALVAVADMMFCYAKLMDRRWALSGLASLGSSLGGFGGHAERLDGEQKELQEEGNDRWTAAQPIYNDADSSSEVDIDQTMSLINGMEEQLDEVLLSSVVEACVRIGKPDLLNTKLRQLMSGDIKVNGSHTFGSLIKAYGHAHDMKSVWRCWKEMRTRHIKPTSITVGCMIEAVVSNGDPDGAWHLIQELGEDPSCKGILNAVIYCSVLKGFTREKNAAKVWAVYEAVYPIAEVAG
eukprot:g1870.t1